MTYLLAGPSCRFNEKLLLKTQSIRRQALGHAMILKCFKLYALRFTLDESVF